MYRLGRGKGTALILTIIILLSLTVVALAFTTMIHYEINAAGVGLRNMQAFHIAEAGLAKARWALTTGEQELPWEEEDTSFGEGTYTVTAVDNEDGTCTITSSGYIPDDTNPIAQRQVVEKDITVTSGSGTNLSLAATATASSEQGSNTADKSNDGSSSSKWQSNVNNGSWLKHDFGSSTTFDQIVVDGSKIDSYTIEYSDNDIDYSEVDNLVEDPAWTFTFDQVSARYLRFSVNGKQPAVNELETYDTSEGTTTLGKGEFVTSW